MVGLNEKAVWADVKLEELLLTTWKSAIVDALVMDSSSKL